MISSWRERRDFVTCTAVVTVNNKKKESSWFPVFVCLCVCVCTWVDRKDSNVNFLFFLILIGHTIPGNQRKTFRSFSLNKSDDDETGSLSLDTWWWCTTSTINPNKQKKKNSGTMEFSVATSIDTIIGDTFLFVLNAWAISEGVWNQNCVFVF